VGGGNVLGQMAINSMALPPIIMAGSQYLKDKVIRDVVTGKKHVCLAISEPYAGSDVASIRTTAVRKGDVYIVNGGCGGAATRRRRALTLGPAAMCCVCVVRVVLVVLVR
jgi:alkylation response protein AidB-like acyl-CoA dehydrogenase